MQKAISYFFSDYNYKNQSGWFKKLLYALLLVKCCYWLMYYDLLFGSNSIVYTKPFNLGFINGIAFLLYKQMSVGAGLWFIGLLIGLCILNIFKVNIYFLSDFIVWLLVINIHNKIYPTLTGGEYLLNQLLFFNCFICNKFNDPDINGWKCQLKTCIHNLGVLSVIVQICLIYLFSAMAKLGNESWLNGSAVGIISQIDHYSLPSISNSLARSGFLMVSLNYIVLGYQLLFPVVVWIKKIKRPFIVIGILMHLYIALVMGLVSFGFIMILPYLYFWPEKEKV